MIDDDVIYDGNPAKFLFVVFGWQCHPKPFQGSVVWCSFPSGWWAHCAVGQTIPLLFQLQIEIIFVGIRCFFSSMLHVYAENWISSHIKCYQIKNFTLKLVSHELWLKDKYSIYLPGLQQAPVLHEYCELLMNILLIFLTTAILFLFSSLSPNAQQLIVLPGRMFEYHSHSQFSFFLTES